MKSTALDSRTKAVNAAMRRAAKTAASRARAAGTKLHVMRNGKLVSEKP
jgi:Arc/MetJ family transcription regulator